MNILNDILEVKKDEVKKLRRNFSASSFSSMELFEKKTLSFINSVDRESHLSVIAEIKKASPSKGVIRPDFNHQKIAETYFNAGASAVSVLTDEIFFQGSLSYLSDIARFNPVPLLRKDFIIDEFQVFQSKAAGADLILLICEALSASQINELSHAAYELGMEVLLELHSEDQIVKINTSHNKLIGINNRDLNTFNVDIRTTVELSLLLPDDTIIVSESGIGTRKDIDFIVEETPASAVLVGESLMREKDIRSKLQQLIEWCLIES